MFLCLSLLSIRSLSFCFLFSLLILFLYCFTVIVHLFEKTCDSFYILARPDDHYLLFCRGVIRIFQTGVILCQNKGTRLLCRYCLKRLTKEWVHGYHRNPIPRLCSMRDTEVIITFCQPNFLFLNSISYYMISCNEIIWSHHHSVVVVVFFFLLPIDNN